MSAFTVFVDPEVGRGRTLSRSPRKGLVSRKDALLNVHTSATPVRKSAAPLATPRRALGDVSNNNQLWTASKNNGSLLPSARKSSKLSVRADSLASQDPLKSTMKQSTTHSTTSLSTTRQEQKRSMYYDRPIESMGLNDDDLQFADPLKAKLSNVFCDDFGANEKPSLSLEEFTPEPFAFDLHTDAFALDDPFSSQPTQFPLVGEKLAIDDSDPW
eukprot:m.81881 g.81881  ORF g.81881 m.81881 type:complete len:215 (-) comp14273_c2_seq1:223-867(-)